MRLRRSLLALLLGAALFAPPAAAQSVQWRKWNDGLRAASTSARPVLVDVYTDWCTWCKRMDRDVYGRADVREYLNKKFVTIKLNAESNESATYDGRGYTGRTLASRFEVNGYPTTIFLRPNGEKLVNVPGYLPPERFLLLARYIGDGHMDRGVSWDDYVKQSKR